MPAGRWIQAACAPPMLEPISGAWNLRPVPAARAFPGPTPFLCKSLLFMQTARHGTHVQVRCLPRPCRFGGTVPESRCCAVSAVGFERNLAQARGELGNDDLVFRRLIRLSAVPVRARSVWLHKPGVSLQTVTCWAGPPGAESPPRRRYIPGSAAPGHPLVCADGAKRRLQALSMRSIMPTISESPTSSPQSFLAYQA